MPALPDDEIDRSLSEDLPGWRREGDSITRTVEASSFPDGIALVQRVAEAAEAMNHHPDIDIRYTNVTFTLSTHSEGGLTSKDLELAGRIDSLLT
ncbi:MAG: 4a-hydroxytetrahydrobiopterin dehydratase [Nocardioidaceae bacterium]|jgi:4a-hydroxytetrahydrobiopterin dehydratase